MGPLAWVQVSGEEGEGCPVMYVCVYVRSTYLHTYVRTYVRIHVCIFFHLNIIYDLEFWNSCCFTPGWLQTKMMYWTYIYFYPLHCHLKLNQ